MSQNSELLIGNDELLERYYRYRNYRSESMNTKEQTRAIEEITDEIHSRMRPHPYPHPQDALISDDRVEQMTADTLFEKQALLNQQSALVKAELLKRLENVK